MKKTTYLVIVCAVLFLAGGLYYFFREEPPAPPDPATQTTSDASTQMSLSGTSINEEENGKKIWELGAETMEVNPQTKIVTLKNLKGILYTHDGGKIELTAVNALVDPTTRNLTVDGQPQPRAVTDDGAVFTAAQMHYDGQGGQFYGTGGVTVTRDDTVITGDQLTGDTGLTKIKVQGNAHIRKGGTNP